MTTMSQAAAQPAISLSSGGSLRRFGVWAHAIAAYLADGTVPARLHGNRSDKLCPPVPQPDPTALARKRQAAGGMPAVLRDALMKAQTHF